MPLSVSHITVQKFWSTLLYSVAWVQWRIAERSLIYRVHGQLTISSVATNHTQIIAPPPPCLPVNVRHLHFGLIFLRTLFCGLLKCNFVNLSHAAMFFVIRPTIRWSDLRNCVIVLPHMLLTSKLPKFLLVVTQSGFDKQYIERPWNIKSLYLCLKYV